MGLFDFLFIKKPIKNVEDKQLNKRFIARYQEISESEIIPERAAKYRSKMYPLNKSNNQYLGSFFTIGYNLRRIEGSFSEEYHFDITEVKHNTETLKILKTDIPITDKIEQIAEFKESNNTTCYLGPEVKDYSVLGLDLVNDYFSFLLIDFMKANGLANILKSQSDMIIEISGRNAALGYCYRLAEEIVENYEKTDVNPNI